MRRIRGLLGSVCGVRLGIAERKSAEVFRRISEKKCCVFECIHIHAYSTFSHSLAATMYTLCIDAQTHTYTLTQGEGRTGGGRGRKVRRQVKGKKKNNSARGSAGPSRKKEHRGSWREIRSGARWA